MFGFGKYQEGGMNKESPPDNSDIQSMMDFAAALEYNDINPLKIKKLSDKYRGGDSDSHLNKLPFQIDEYFKDFQWYEDMMSNMEQEEYRHMYDEEGTMSLAPEGRRGSSIAYQPKARVLGYLADQISGNLESSGIDINTYRPPYEASEVDIGDDGLFIRYGSTSNESTSPTGNRYNNSQAIFDHLYRAGVTSSQDELPSMQYRKKKFGY